MHLQLAPVRINELPKRVTVPGLCPGEQVHRHDASLSSATAPKPAHTDDGTNENWAAAGRPV
jgi:hypothetical protein